MNALCDCCNTVKAVTWSYQGCEVCFDCHKVLVHIQVPHYIDFSQYYRYKIAKLKKRRKHAIA